MRFLKISILPITVVIVFLTVLFLANNTNPSKTNGDLTTFLEKNKADEQTKSAYYFAKENPAGILDEVSCYCGCLDLEHKNARECFINPVEETEEYGEYDLMGLNCGLCVKTALITKELQNENKNGVYIKDYIDNKYKNEG